MYVRACVSALCTIENGTYVPYTYDCMYDICILCMYVCVRACFVGKTKSTDIVSYNGLSSRDANSRMGPQVVKIYAGLFLLWVIRCVECKKCRPIIIIKLKLIGLWPLMVFISIFCPEHIQFILEFNY